MFLLEGRKEGAAPSPSSHRTVKVKDSFKGEGISDVQSLSKSHRNTMP